MISDHPSIPAPKLNHVFWLYGLEHKLGASRKVSSDHHSIEVLSSTLKHTQPNRSEQKSIKDTLVSKRLWWAVALAFLLCMELLLQGCAAPMHITQPERTRKYEVGQYGEPAKPVSDGSLWQNSSRGLFADFRASRIGDVVTIRIDETANASGDANTDLERESQMSFGLPKLFGLTAVLQKVYPEFDPTELVKLASSSSFRGDGETSRGGRARGTVAVRVKQLMPNGDMFVEGTKVIMINEEELHIYLSGVIRPEDIEHDNSIPSSRVADAQIEFSGHGSLSDNQRRGWLAKLISKIRLF